MRKFLSFKGRSTWKGFFFQNKRNMFGDNRRRNVCITSYDQGKVIYVSTGKDLKPFRVKAKHIGFKFGQFLWTKKMGSASHLKTVPVKKKKK